MTKKPTPTQIDWETVNQICETAGRQHGTFPVDALAQAGWLHDPRRLAARMRRSGIELVVIATTLGVTYAEADDLARRGRNLVMTEEASLKDPPK